MAPVAKISYCCRSVYVTPIARYPIVAANLTLAGTASHMTVSCFMTSFQSNQIQSKFVIYLCAHLLLLRSVVFVPKWHMLLFFGFYNGRSDCNNFYVAVYDKTDHRLSVSYFYE